MKKLTTDENTVNESGMSEKAVFKRLHGGDTITYGEMSLMVEPGAVARAVEDARKLSFSSRSRVHASVDVALKSALQKMESGDFDKETADNFYADLLIWEALKRTAS